MLMAETAGSAPAWDMFQPLNGLAIRAVMTDFGMFPNYFLQIILMFLKYIHNHEFEYKMEERTGVEPARAINTSY